MINLKIIAIILYLAAQDQILSTAYVGKDFCSAKTAMICQAWTFVWNGLQLTLNQVDQNEH